MTMRWMLVCCARRVYSGAALAALTLTLLATSGCQKEDKPPQSSVPPGSTLPPSNGPHAQPADPSAKPGETPRPASPAPADSAKQPQ
jgi:hypothetical protein